MLSKEIKLRDSATDEYPTLNLKLKEYNNRLEIILPDGQIVAIEQWLGQPRLIHWHHEDDEDVIIIPLTD